LNIEHSYPDKIVVFIPFSVYEFLVKTSIRSITTKLTKYISLLSPNLYFLLIRFQDILLQIY